MVNMKIFTLNESRQVGHNYILRQLVNYTINYNSLLLGLGASVLPLCVAGGFSGMALAEGG